MGDGQQDDRGREEAGWFWTWEEDQRFTREKGRTTGWGGIGRPARTRTFSVGPQGRANPGPSQGGCFPLVPLPVEKFHDHRFGRTPPRRGGPQRNVAGLLPRPQSSQNPLRFSVPLVFPRRGTAPWRQLA
jgi:hypothetical protein